jgi:hypothetical protein
VFYVLVSGQPAASQLTPITKSKEDNKYHGDLAITPPILLKPMTCKVINTGDLLAGKDGASKLEVLDAMIANWMTDPVHGGKAGYGRVAVKLIEKMEEKPIISDGQTP